MATDTILSIQTTTASELISIYIGGPSGTNNINIDWGDTQSDTISGTGSASSQTHTYTSAGTYT